MDSKVVLRRFQSSSREGATNGCGLRVSDSVDPDEPVAVGKRQRPQQHGVDGRKDRAVGADAERQREDDGEREARRFRQRPRGEAQIAQRRFQAFGDIHIAGPFDLQIEAAELAARQAAGFGGRTLFAQFVDPLGDVEGKFLFQVALQPVGPRIFRRRYARP